MKKVKLGRPSTANFNIIGIVCSKPDYWLSLHLNKTLGFTLTRKKDLSVFQDKLNKFFHYSFYAYEDEWNRKVYFIKNGVSEDYLFSKYKNFHYFLLLDGFSSKTKDIDSQIKTIPSILASIPFPFDSIPKINYFMEDFEMHLLKISKPKKRPM